MEETQTTPQVSVLIVSYNRAEALRRCLAALERSAGRETFEIVVVDNGSQDGSVGVIAEFPNVTPLHLPRNFGFTKALNIGMRTAKGEFFFFLNPRTEVLADTVSTLAAQLAAQPDAVAVSPLLDGASHLYKLPRPENVGALAGAGAFEEAAIETGGDTPVEVEFAGFAALMVRAYFLKGLRYIDERYAQSWADAEIAAQIRRAGRKTLLVPAARATWHSEDDLRETMPPQAVALLESDWKLGAAAFAGKHFGYAAGLKVRIASALGALAAFQIRRFTYLLSGQKIDGTQNVM
ncbi:MAG: glycosyltransferase family 2 protein [Acidobacteriota bacterium]